MNGIEEDKEKKTKMPKINSSVTPLVTTREGTKLCNTLLLWMFTAHILNYISIWVAICWIFGCIRSLKCITNRW